MRCGCDAVAFIFLIYLRPVLYEYNELFLLVHLSLPFCVTAGHVYGMCYSAILLYSYVRPTILDAHNNALQEQYLEGV